MYVIQKCAMSLDGCIDDASSNRLILSNEQDFAYVDEVRAQCDAILVGANTLRKDDSRLRIRNPLLQSQRIANDKPPHPTKVTVTASGELNHNLHFLDSDSSEKLIYTIQAHYKKLRRKIGNRAKVISLNEGKNVEFPLMFEDLATRNIDQLLVEGGTSVHTQCLQYYLADELQLSVAPFFVCDPNAPTFVRSTSLPFNKKRPMKLLETRQFDSVVMLRYSLEKTTR